VLELGEDEESLGAQRTARPGEQISGDRSRACPLSCGEVRMGSCERPSTTLIGMVNRRQPKRVLCKLGGVRWRAAIACESGGVIEETRNVGVRRINREREVTGAKHRLFGDLRDPCVNGPPLFAEAVVEDRRQQRVGEADHPALTLDHARGDGRVERVRCNARALEQRLGRRAHDGRERKRLPGGRRERRDPRPHDLFERLGDGKRLKRIEVRRENAGQFQRKERVPTRPLVNTQ
jgi:hypothetical protein